MAVAREERHRRRRQGRLARRNGPGATQWVDGPRGGALAFDGSTGYADAGEPVPDTGRDYWVAAWMRLDNPGFRTAVFIEGWHESVFYLQYSGYDRRFSLSFVNVRALAARVGPAAFGRWYHLVGTYLHSAGLLSLYVNGALAGSAHADNPEPAAGHLLIGRAKTDDEPADFWSGAICDVHAYQRVLTPSEVRALAAAEPGA
ncbi:LamG domain-containing protein [Streptomyces sp. CG1]|uniref:LamG domain-containing protein n=1 Tax=Streptomyces sp. CG1 TaxID=1287523 RepID=UPI0034E29019